MVAFDSVGPSAAGSGGASPRSYTHTTVAASTVVVVGASLDGVAVGVTATCTIGGVTATSLGQVAAGGGTTGIVQAWWLAGVAAGAHTIVVTCATAADVEAGSMAYSGAGRVGVPFTAQSSGTSTTASVAVTANSSPNMIAGFVACGDTVNSTTQTSRWVANTEGGAGQATGNGSGADAASTGSTVTMSWGINISPWAVIAVEVQPPIPPQPPPLYLARPAKAWQLRFQPRQMLLHPPAGIPATVVNAGLATGTGVAASPSYPLVITGQTGTGWAAYFSDQHGAPRLYVCAETWGLPANAGRWSSGNWQGDYDNYHSVRSGQGYTANITHPWGHTHTGCNNDLGHTWDGLFPFAVAGTDANLTGQGGAITLSSSGFWTRIDYMLTSAARYGITVFLDMAMSNDMPTGAGHGFTNGIFQNASTAQIQAASQLVAARYAATQNLVWFFGDDYYNDDDTNFNAMWTGINAADSRVASCTAIEYYPTGNTSRYDLSGAPGGETPHGWGNTHATYNFVYCYMQVYFGIEYAYTEPTQLGPVVWGDGMFWGNGGTSLQNDQLQRNNTWWALASGARGFVAENENVLQWTATAAASLTGDGAYPATITNIRTLFTGLPGWQKLIPDTGNVLVTAGRGTRATYSSSEYLANTDTYVAASRVADGSLAVIYCAAAMSITIDQTKVAPGYTATWYDPASGAATPVTAGSTYNSTGLGNNSAGGSDWVLVLQGTPVVAGLATGTGAALNATAQTSAGTTVTAVLASGAGTAQGAIPAIAVNAVLAAGTGAAQGVIAAIRVNAGLASGAGTAQGAVPAIAVNAVLAAGTGAAQGVIAAIRVNAGLASGAGSAQSPAAAVAVTAVLAAGTGAAQGAVPSTAASVTAVLASGTGAAQGPVPAIGVNAVLASAAGTARSPVAAAGVNAAVATGTGTGQNATVSTSSSGSANAVLASGTGAAQPPATAGSGIFRLMDGVAGRPGNGPGSPSGAGAGNFIAGMLWKVTANGLWLTGYWHWVPAGGDTIPKKFALWQLTDTTHGTSQALVPAGTVTSGTMTAGAWNYVPLPAPIGLSGSVPYCVAVGWVVVNGFPDTQNQFGSGNTYSAGITSGPVFAYSDQGGSATEPYTSNYNQGLFSVASADPAAVMPTTGDVHSNFWVDVQVSYLPPSGATYRLWPSQPYATGWVDDTADNFTLGCEFTLNQPCVLGKLWFYSQPGVTQLPTECGIWNVATQSLVSGTDNASPSWSGAAGSGWVSCSYTGVTLPAGDYKAAVLNAAGSPAIWNPTTNGYWGTGPGAGGVNNGPVGAPDTAHATAPGQDTYNLGASFTYPLTFAGGANGANYWVDVEVTPLTAGLATGTGTAGQATAAIGVNAVVATGAGAALNATASTSASATANAVLATGTGAAQNPAIAIGVFASLATGTGTAQSPVVAIAVTAVLASGAGTAQSPVVAIAVTAVLASGAGTALNPGILGGVVTSPALEGYGFGSFSQVPAGSVVISVIAAITVTGSNIGIGAPSYQLWDGASAQIGASQNGVASTDPAHIDTVTFTGITYSQLATLRLRMFCDSASGNSGATASADAVSLSVVWAPVVSTTVTPAVLAVPAAFPGPAVSTGMTAAPAVLAVAVSFPAATAGLLNATVQAVSLAVPAQLPASAVSAVTTASAAPAVLAVAVTFPGSTAGLLNATAAPGFLAVTTALPLPAASGVTAASAAPAALAVAVTFPGSTAGIINAAVLPGVLAVTMTLPGVTVTAVTSASAAPAVLAVLLTFPGAAVSANETSPAWTSAQDIPVAGSGTWVNPGNIIGVPDGADAVWTTP